MSAGDWKEMYVAAQDGNLELVTYHIRSGVNPNYQHPEILSTPLVTAILAGHTDVAEYLLNNGADPQIKSYYDDMTALQAAAKMQNEVLLKVLSDRGFSLRTNWFRNLWQKFKK